MLLIAVMMYMWNMNTIQPLHHNNKISLTSTSQQITCYDNKYIIEKCHNGFNIIDKELLARIEHYKSVNGEHDMDFIHFHNISVSQYVMCASLCPKQEPLYIHHPLYYKVCPTMAYIYLHMESTFLNEVTSHQDFHTPGTHSMYKYYAYILH
jgi:hypothetical protein